MGRSWSWFSSATSGTCDSLDITWTSLLTWRRAYSAQNMIVPDALPCVVWIVYLFFRCHALSLYILYAQQSNESLLNYHRCV